MCNSQKGVSLVITFLIMTIMLAGVLGFSTILFNKIKILGNIGNSISAFYAAQSGIERTLYFDRKEIPKKSARGLCNICNTCNDCDECTATDLSLGGCNVNTCNNCEVSYEYSFSGRTYKVLASTTPSVFFVCSSKGEYINTTRTINITSASISETPIGQ